MFARFDVVSETTGRVLLRAAYDMPPDGLTRKECHKLIKILAETRKRLEEALGRGSVRLSLDDYSASVFWFLVMHRPIDFDPDNLALGKHSWTPYEFCLNPKLAKKFKQLNLGLVYDEARNWLVLIWPEAVHGVLEGFENSPSWGEILEREGKRLGEISTEWWKACAQSHSFVIPPWRLFRLNYLQQVLWHRPGLTYDDITVFDLAGVDIPSIDQQGLAVLPMAKRARFVHFYTEDKREFQDMKKILGLQVQRDPKGATRSEVTRQWKLAREEKRKKYWWASRCIQRIFFLYGGAKVKHGKFRKYLDPIEADRMYDDVLTFLSNGIVAKSVTKVDDLLVELELYLPDPCVPRNFERWLTLKEGAKEILELPKGDSDAQPS